MVSPEDFRRLADEMAIRAVLAEYCLRLEVNDFEDWLDLFTPDTTYEVFRRTLTGRDEVRAMLSQAPHGLHIGGPARVVLDGDAAETVQNYLFIGSADAAWNMGWYFRRLVRSVDGWKIAHTRVKMQKIGTGTPPLLEPAQGG
jgi:hypothetical protein